MKHKFLNLTAALTLAAFASTLAQADDTIKDRKVEQQKRIANGAAKGQLTPKETVNLENKQAKLNKEIRTDRKANGGNLTNKEKAQVNRQQNKLSNQIYDKKHDVPPAK